MPRKTEVLWAPWRLEYVTGPKDGECFLCRIAGERRDTENLIITRSGVCFSLMNRFPYNNGHVMVAPFRHVAELENLTEEESKGIFNTVASLLKALRKTLRAEGFNVGANLGKVAGAGVESHFHFHIVPRWKGDTNFMPVVATTKVMPEHISTTYKKIRDTLLQLKET